MFTVGSKRLGKLIGQGKEHLVFAKNDKYVYKVFTLKIKNIFTLIRVIYQYLDSRNSIPYQLPCKFVGITYYSGYLFPIFKQRRVKPLDRDYELPDEYKDVRKSNFGIYDGKVVAIDIYKYKVRL